MTIILEGVGGVREVYIHMNTHTLTPVVLARVIPVVDPDKNFCIRLFPVSTT